MKRIKISGISAIVVLAAFAASPAMAADSAAGRINIGGLVPLVCNATYQPNITAQADGSIALGAVVEFCNAGQGYRVIADYAVGSDPGVLIVNGQNVPLSSSGQTVIARTDGPAILSRDIAYRPGSTPISAIHITLSAFAI